MNLDTEIPAPTWDITKQPEKEDEPHLETRDATGPSEENHSPYISSEGNSPPQSPAEAGPPLIPGADL